jgi:CheY-like chemotaxis protein
MHEPQSVHLLHVEDDDICLMGLVRALKKANVTNAVSSAHDGIDALEMLRGTGGRERLARPFLIVLDLNMPRMNGIEFLTELRRDEDLKRSIVFVMTTSNADQDKFKAYDLGIAGYLLKSNPADARKANPGDAFREAAMLLDAYFRVVEFPPA